MPPRSETVAARLVPVARLRRTQAPVRAVAVVVAGASFALGLNLQVMWLWLAAYAAAGVFEVSALNAFLRPGAAPSRLRTAAVLGAVAASASALGSLALLLVQTPSALGAAAAMLLLCSGVLNVLAVSRGSAEAFIAGAVPYVLLSGWTALSLQASPLAHDRLAPALALAVVGLAVTVGLIWRDGERTHAREREVLRELERRRREAEAAWEARQLFVAAVGHELRTPLSAILAASGALEAAAPTADERGRASQIANASRLMRRLLDDLLDLARLEAGRMPVERVAFDAAALVRESVALWSAPAEAKGLVLSLQGDGALPVRALGDGMRISQLLNNLLSNAVKFTATGGVTLGCRAQPAWGGGWELALDVADTGPGLDDEALARLFQPFAQQGAETARLHGGSGLGLAISRELARVMGGSLAARRGPDGRGAVFTLTLRLEEAEPAPAPAADRTITPTLAGARPRILVVDDHALGRQALRALLEADGAQVSEAPGGEEALDTLSEQPFDLVLMDVTMPGVDGREAVRRLRAGGGPNAATPVLGVTGLCGDADVRACLAAGMDGHVEKPCEAQALYDAVAGALARGRPAPAAGRAAGGLAA